MKYVFVLIDMRAMYQYHMQVNGFHFKMKLMNAFVVRQQLKTFSTVLCMCARYSGSDKNFGLLVTENMGEKKSVDPFDLLVVCI